MALDLVVGLIMGGNKLLFIPNCEDKCHLPKYETIYMVDYLLNWLICEHMDHLWLTDVYMQWG